jgi:TorA maturation chaperone TorD
MNGAVEIAWAGSAARRVERPATKREYRRVAKLRLKDLRGILE